MIHLKKILGNVLLLLIAVVLSPLLFIWGIIELIINLFVGRHFFKALAKFSDVFKVIGVVLDIFIGYILQVPLNRLLITPDGYKFGQMPDTMSYALGRNQINKTTSLRGDTLINILNVFEKEHSTKTVRERDNR